MATISSEAHIIQAPNEYRLGNMPEDGISCCRFSPDPQSRLLLVSSWDCTVRLYDVGTNANDNAQRFDYRHAAPVLCCDFMDPNRCASGGLDNQVKTYDLYTGDDTTMGTHERPVRVCQFSRNQGLLITGSCVSQCAILYLKPHSRIINPLRSWDKTIKLWDPRTRSAASTHEQPDKVYAMSTTGPYVIVGTAGRKVCIWDLRQMSQPEQKRDSSLKYQTRHISAFPNGQAYVISSIEGRVAVEYLSLAEQQTKKYAFKCHRNKEDGQEYIHPVNAVAFHPVYNTFATGGSDTLVNVWDPFNKKRLCQFHKYPASISSLAFNETGNLLAIASSYQYELAHQPNPMPPNTIFLRKVTDQETKPKY